MECVNRDILWFFLLLSELECWQIWMCNLGCGSNWVSVRVVDIKAKMRIGQLRKKKEWNKCVSGRIKSSQGFRETWERGKAGEN